MRRLWVGFSRSLGGQLRPIINRSSSSIAVAGMACAKSGADVVNRDLIVFEDDVRFFVVIFAMFDNLDFDVIRTWMG